LRYRELGNSGVTVSLVSLGCNNFGASPVVAPTGTVYGFMDLTQTRAVVDAAIDAGINLFDTADVYGRGGSERLLGEIFKGRRREVIIATKWGSGLEDRPEIRWGTREYIRQALEASLTRLQTDYIDLYQMHWPDPLTDIEETLGALDELVREGKIRCAGMSHFSASQIEEARRIARERSFAGFVAAQDHYSLLKRGAESTLMPACRACDMSLLPYFPLENGLLTGKYRRGLTAAGVRMAGRAISAATFDVLEALEAFARERGHTLLELAIAAPAAKTVVASVVTGATRPDQIRANAAAADWLPGSEDLAALEQLLARHPVTDLVA
jgi:aryl-alcohol dehydrogenase-like predicted oxidoreductase